METINKDEIVQLYLRLKALKNNLPDGSINERYVTEYLAILDRFLLLVDGSNINDFRVLDSDLERRLISFNRLTGERNYSSDRYIDRGIFLSKLEAFCEYIKIKFKDILENI